VMLQVATVSRLGKTRKMMTMIQSLAGSVMMMNLAGDGDILQNSIAPHEEFSAEADKASRNDPTGMGGCSQLLPGEKYEVGDCQMEGSGSCPAPNRHDCSQTIANNTWRVYISKNYIFFIKFI